MKPTFTSLTRDERRDLLRRERGILSAACRRMNPQPDASLLSRVFWGSATSARAAAAIQAEINERAKIRARANRRESRAQGRERAA